MSFRMSLQLSAAKLLKIFEIHKIFNKKCKRIRILCCKTLLCAQKNLHFSCRFILSPFPKPTEAPLGEGRYVM